MTWTLSNFRTTLLAVTLAGVILSFLQVSAAAGQTQTSGVSPSAQAVDPEESNAAARLDKKQFHNVKVSMDQGVATLTGTVDLYGYKAEADKRVRKVKGVTAVHNLIQVGGSTIPDEVLEKKLGEKLEYDQVFYGNVFNAISLSVHNGVVTLGGHAFNYFNSRDSALALVSYYPGVKGMEDEIQVDPVSMVDDRIRMQVYRAVYGYPALTKYAIDPGKPIRISVQNGHVELYGMVDTQADKNIAFMRANGVPGIFKVENFLQIATPPAPKQKK
ncbi:MAG TPA: BON domain-containing protein [Terracidiphilus sp.]|jgi:osmotically-inducible protein OsmY